MIKADAGAKYRKGDGMFHQSPIAHGRGYDRWGWNHSSVIKAAISMGLKTPYEEKLSEEQEEYSRIPMTKCDVG
jgi:hypothetical protein